MSILGGDLRYGLRGLRKHPGFTAIAIASLALGIGVNTAIFSLVDQLLLWSIPARDPQRLVSVEGGRTGSYPFTAPTATASKCSHRYSPPAVTGLPAFGRKGRPPSKWATWIT